MSLPTSDRFHCLINTPQRTRRMTLPTAWFKNPGLCSDTGCNSLPFCYPGWNSCATEN